VTAGLLSRKPDEGTHAGKFARRRSGSKAFGAPLRQKRAQIGGCELE
jgi:hypothetical protein